MEQNVLRGLFLVASLFSIICSLILILAHRSNTLSNNPHSEPITLVSPSEKSTRSPTTHQATFLLQSVCILVILMQIILMVGLFWDEMCSYQAILFPLLVNGIHTLLVWLLMDAWKATRIVASMDGENKSDASSLQSIQSNTDSSNWKKRLVFICFRVLPLLHCLLITPLFFIKPSPHLTWKPTNVRLYCMLDAPAWLLMFQATIHAMYTICGTFCAIRIVMTAWRVRVASLAVSGMTNVSRFWCLRLTATSLVYMCLAMTVWCYESYAAMRVSLTQSYSMYQWHVRRVQVFPDQMNLVFVQFALTFTPVAVGVILYLMFGFSQTVMNFWITTFSMNSRRSSTASVVSIHTVSSASLTVITPIQKPFPVKFRRRSSSIGGGVLQFQKECAMRERSRMAEMLNVRPRALSTVLEEQISTESETNDASNNV